MRARLGEIEGLRRQVFVDGALECGEIFPRIPKGARERGPLQMHGKDAHVAFGLLALGHTELFAFMRRIGEDTRWPSRHAASR